MKTSRVDVPNFQQVVTPPPALGADEREDARRSLSPWAMISGQWAPRVGLATFEGVLAQEWVAAVSPAASHGLRG